MTRLTGCLCLALALAASAAGCGGDGGSDGTREAATEKAADLGEGVTEREEVAEGPAKGAWGVAFGAEGELGIIIYDLSGHTLYTFSKDEGKASTCYGACAKAWPPALTENKPRAEGEASAAMVGAAERKDGTVQLTYAGHPLYRYSGDKSAEVNGNGAHAFGGEWRPIKPNGEAP